MEEVAAFGITFCIVLLNLPSLSEAREFCSVGGYWCDTGHCCGNGDCCTYYYELWWFWLVWFLIVFIIGFCVWQRKRFHPWRGNSSHRTCSIQDFLRGFNFDNITPVPPCKLPSYSEIGDTVGYDTPPPPYTYYYIQAATTGFGNTNNADCDTCGNSSGLSALTPRLTEVAIETAGVDGGESRLETPDSSEAPPSYAQIMETSREREMRVRAVAEALTQTLTPSRTPAATPSATPAVSTPVTPAIATPRPTPAATPAATPRPTPVATPAVTPAVSRSPKSFSPAGSPKRLSPATSPLRQCNEHGGGSRSGTVTPTPATTPVATPSHLASSGNSSASDRAVTSTIVDLQISDKGSLNYVTRLT
ncbi:uncharacterized protein LOC110987885 [Acanthaster planci]|uniref:Uncharacterized protein LOC110987885 n=1 Tax=Acanthaster planci TaxID=133434 RepID=A0A8B7ZTA9_ACAPL|nr:uncharacterized protein LOC110987885 [Acanthaster planci]